MGDIVLRQDVLDELEFEPRIDAAHIGVAVEKGVVTLTGHVATYAEKLAAERAVQRVKGVRAIAQDIQVRFPEEKKTADDEIAGRALSIMAWEMGAASDKVRVKVQDGWVTLSGETEWYFQKESAENAVRKLSGVVGLTNAIVIRPCVDAADVRRSIKAALERNADIEANEIEIAVDGSKVTLEGKIRTWHERAVAERAAWAAAGVTDVDDRLSLF